MIKYRGIFTVIRRPRAEMFCTRVIDWAGGRGRDGEPDRLGARDNRGCREAWMR